MNASALTQGEQIVPSFTRARSKTRGRIMIAALLAGVTALVASGCSEPAAEESPAPTTAPSVAEGPATGKITVYTSEPQAKIDAIVAAFNASSPDIQVEVFRAGTGDLNARIAAEREAGDIQADVLLAADAPTFEGYKAEGLLLPFQPEGVEALDPAVVDPEGYYVGTRIIPTVIAYNTSLVSEPPTSWADLTDARFNEQIAVPNPDVSGAAAYNTAVWLNTPEIGITWLKALSLNEPVVLESNGPVSQAVASGTQQVGIVVDYLVRELAEKGSPIALSYPTDGVPYVTQPAGIFSSSKNSAAAQAFIEFLISKEGQQLAVEQSYVPVRADVPTAEGIPPLSDLKLLTPDVETITRTQSDAIETFNGLF
jgi:iron(III) transport system substrate-binding protein